LYDTLNEETAPVYQDNQVLGYGAKWSPDGTRIAFFDANSHAIRVVPLAGGDAAVIPSDMGEVGSFSPDGNQMVYSDIRPVGQQFFTALWLANFDAEGGLQMLVDEPEEDQSPAWSPNNSMIAFGRRRLDRQGGFASQLMLYDAETGELRAITSDATYNNTRFSWSPSGDQLVVQRFNLDQMQAVSSLWVYDMEDGSMRQVVDNGFGAVWLP
jgi:Tol biopolymer transport system component